MYYFPPLPFCTSCCAQCLAPSGGDFRPLLSIVGKGEQGVEYAGVVIEGIGFVGRSSFQK